MKASTPSWKSSRYCNRWELSCVFALFSPGRIRHNLLPLRYFFHLCGAPSHRPRIRPSNFRKQSITGIAVFMSPPVTDAAHRSRAPDRNSDRHVRPPPVWSSSARATRRRWGSPARNPAGPCAGTGGAVPRPCHLGRRRSGRWTSHPRPNSGSDPSKCRTRAPRAS